jgi:UTP--glucose-1-phosphate uridylyltransferase
MKAIIPAAGYGTRFLPWTKAMPKEMLPIVDKPVIQYVVEEIVDSGINDIIIVTGAQKRAIEDHFDFPYEDLVKNLIAGNKQNYLDQINKIADMANFYYVRQKGAYGNGTPVLCAEHLIGDESCAVLWGDEFIQGTPPRLKQMLDVHHLYPDAVIISAIRIPNKKDLSRYGIADITLINDNVYKINSIVEKPNPDDAPSNLATHGAYILPPSIFDALRKV